MNAIYGKKLGMSRVFTETGDSVGVTVIEVEPVYVVRLKTAQADGYNAAVVCFGNSRPALLTKPFKGQFEKFGAEPKKYLRELPVDSSEAPEKGSKITVGIFKPGEKVHITAVSRGLGFQGGVKRHHFSGGPKTHGQSDRLRAPGSIGASSYPSRVFKGQRMAGHMGDKQVTVKNVKVVGVESDQNLLLLEGPIPGHRNSIVYVRKAR